MNLKNFIAAAAVFIATGTAFAAETHEVAATTGTAASVATASAPEASQAPARKDDTADIVKEYKTPLAIQLDQYKN